MEMVGLRGMKISFVIPAHNEEATVGKCLTSVLKEIETNHLEIGKDVEVVVVNNASTDKTKEVVQKFAAVRLVDEPTKGLVHARKAGFDNSTGELVANIDSDTHLPTGWLAVVLKNFNNTHVVGLSGPYIYDDISALERAFVKLFYAIGYIFYWIAHYIFRSGAMLQGGNYIVRRDALQKIGGFDTRIIFYGEDTDIAKRLGDVGEVRWTWSLPMYTSGRRLRKEGLLRMGARYAINFCWVNFFGRPYTSHYIDIRAE
jgi:glycosyltransferase involved in cell wall biosynthesis